MAVLGTKTVVGVFDSVSAAEDARATLLEAGVPEKRIALSGGLTDDALAAEAPGQSFENQPGQVQEKKLPNTARPCAAAAAWSAYLPARTRKAITWSA